jgi:tubulin gamma
MLQDVFTIQIGKCGIQSGHEFWKKISSEHLINPEGFYLNFKNDRIHEEKEIFFKETSNGKFIPKTFLFDLDSRTINTLLNGNYKNLYNKNNIFFSTQAGGNNWAKGYFQSIDHQFEIEESLRKNAETFDNLGAFNIFHSIAGGTGSGSGSLILEIIRDNFPGKFVNCFTVIPNSQDGYDAVVQPYNSILSLRWLTLYADCVTLFQNESIEKIINSYEKQFNISLTQINDLISDIISTLTRNIRFPNRFNKNFQDQFAALIPIQNLHFLSSGISNWNIILNKKSGFFFKNSNN